MKKVYLSYEDIHTDSIKLAKKVKNKISSRKLVLITESGLISGFIFANFIKIKNIELISNKNLKSNNERIINNEKLILFDNLARDNLEYKNIKKNIPKSKIIVLYTNNLTKKNSDLSLYNLNNDEKIIFPWEQE